MKNSEIRKKALSKVKAKHLTACAMIAFVIGWVVQFFGDLTGNRVLDAAILFAVSFVASFVAHAGFARVSLTAWRRGEAKVGELFAYLRDPKLFLRGAAPGAVCAALTLVNRLMRDAGASGIAYNVLSVLISLVNLLLYFLYFALELSPGLGTGAALARGCAETLSSLGRILLMELAISWWILLVLLGTAAIAAFAGLGSIGISLVLALAMLLMTWLIGAYLGLVNAGLARTLFKEE